MNISAKPNLGHMETGSFWFHVRGTAELVFSQILPFYESSGNDEMLATLQDFANDEYILMVSFDDYPRDRVLAFMDAARRMLAAFEEDDHPEIFVEDVLIPSVRDATIELLGFLKEWGYN